MGSSQGDRAMKLNIEIGGRVRTVDVVRAGVDGRLQCTIEGRQGAIDAIEITPNIFSILIGGESFEARVEAAPGKLLIYVSGREYAATVQDTRRWRRGERGEAESPGRQHVVAPMPGKIVRLLVKSGDAIEAGQGIVVVEAMKMQNEIRSPKNGTIERLLVIAGQTVTTGEVLAIVV